MDLPTGAHRCACARPFDPCCSPPSPSSWFASPAAAGDFRGATTVTIAEDETVDDDLYVGAGTVSLAGTVDGDATIAGAR